jgi:leucyl-tRNA synthetase
VAIPEKDLPVKLPNVKDYQPSDDGQSPLSRVPKWVNTKCPTCGGKATRETDTMPNWAGSSWYFLRYIDPKNNKSLADSKKLQYWQPVDWYNGGAEHTTLHLLYSRFWNKFLFDIGVVPTDEPYQKRTMQGMILGAGGVKMSKSKGNVVNPDSIVSSYGADTLRVYEMFMGPFDQSIAWSSESIIGSRRFLDKIWNISQKVGKVKPIEAFETLTNKTIKKVGEDIEQMAFNTAISSMMVWANEADKLEVAPISSMTDFVKILAPFAPHICEEIWSNLGNKKSIHVEKWPSFDQTKLQDKITTIVVQINGKVRDSIEIESGTNQENVEKMALQRDLVKKWVDKKNIRKVIYIKDKLLNIVI